MEFWESAKEFVSDYKWVILLLLAIAAVLFTALPVWAKVKKWAKELAPQYSDTLITAGLLAFACWLIFGWVFTTQDDDVISYITGETTRVTFVQFVQGSVAVIGIFISIIAIRLVTARLEDQKKQTASQIRKEVDERFSDAIALLGNSETSARTGAIYTLYHLAVESEKYRKQVAEILCSHIRSKTAEKKYQKQHPARPSNEIQTAIDVLFKSAAEAQGLYAKFSNDLPRANLSHTYLVGANFVTAKCQSATFKEANCQKSTFERAQCQNVNFAGANCRRTEFEQAHCQEANFVGALCHGANFGQSICQRANFMLAQCQGANFVCASCEMASFTHACIQGAGFGNANCQGAFFINTHGEGAYAHPERLFIPLTERIGCGTMLKTAIFSAPLVQSIVEENKGIRPTHKPHPGIIPGVLEDTPEIRQIIKDLNEMGGFPQH